MSEKLKIRNLYIGDLEWGPGGDFPWAKGEFFPTKDFERFRHFFKKLDAPNGNVVNSLNIFELENAGYKSSELTIGEDDDVSYLVGLNLYEDGTAYWRFSMSADDEDE